MAAATDSITLIDKSAQIVDNFGRQKPCQPRARCGLYRTCPICSKIRQSRAADRAESLLGPTGPVMLTVAQPHLGDNSLTRTIKEIALRALSADRGMWSIEASRQRGSLHVNIITPLIDYKPDSRIRMHSSIIEGGPRVAAAYCTKQSQCPSAEEYTGKQYGFFGNPIMALAGKGACSELRAYAAEYTAERILCAAADESKTIQEQMQLSDHMRDLRNLLRQ